MRGFPLFRCLILLLALGVGGMALGWYTRGGAQSPVALTGQTEKKSAAPGQMAGYELVCSAAVKEVVITSLDGDGQPLSEQKPELVALRSQGPLNLATPARILLKIVWQSQEPGMRFARLKLEQEGRATRQHYFDSEGDLEDVWEVEP